MGALGIAISLIGVDSILGSERYTFGFVYLLDGISFVPVMVGLFAITELTCMILEGGTIAKAGSSGRLAVGRIPGHVPLSVHAHPEHGGRRVPRHDPGDRRDRGEFPRLQRGAALVEASGAVRQGRAGRA